MSDVVVCGRELASCRCEREVDHDGNHACLCGGSWTDDDLPVTFPDITRPLPERKEVTR